MVRMTIFERMGNVLEKTTGRAQIHDGFFRRSTDDKFEQAKKSK